MLVKLRSCVPRVLRAKSTAGAAAFASLCGVSIYMRDSLTLERYAVLDEPRGTAVGAIGIAACIIWLVYKLVGQLISRGRRPDEPRADAAKRHVATPKRPPSNAPLAISFCLVLRLEVFLAVNRESQCSSAGVEAFLCVPLLLYEVFFAKKLDEPSEDASDPWGSALVDVVLWLTTSKTMLFVGTAAVSLGVYKAVSQTIRTTYFCSSVHDHASLDLGLQFLGLCLDAGALVLLWRVLWWAEPTQARLRTLFSITRNCLAASSLIFFLAVLFGQSSPRFVHITDALPDGVLLSVFLIASSYLMSESTPLVPLSIVMAMYGTVASLQNVARMKTWLHSSAYVTVTPFYYLCLGFSLILSRSHMNMLSAVFQLFIFLAMMTTIFSSVPISLFRARDNDEVVRHPLDRLIFNSRVESDRWLLKASPSNTLELAVSEYRERNHGRDPPPKFDAWYKFAREKDSVIIDHFDQIQKDIFPFWQVPPDLLRERVDLLREQPGVAMVRLRSGGVSAEEFEDKGDARVLDALVVMISHFSEHLPDMDLPVNLYDYPRVIFTDDTALGPHSPTSLAERRQWQTLSCPSDSAVGSRARFQLCDLDLDYSKMSPRTQFIMNWEKAIKTCNQPDAMHQHGFYLSPPASRPLYTHVPLFSRTKAGGFADIVIPLPRDEEPPSTSSFDSKRDTLYWRGGYGDPSAGAEALRGNHKHRLVHLFNNASASDETVLVLPVRDNTFSYAKVPTQSVNRLLAVDVGFDADAYHSCPAPKACAPALLEFGTVDPVLSPLEHRYPLLLDGDAGPATGPDFMTALQSHSVPFVSSIFTEWFSERVRPWLHFVPVDLRYYGLHSTAAYFTGLDADDDEDDVEVTLGGRTVRVKGATEDAKWIAAQGKTWAERALRREDMEVYLFRLLLEWGRLVDDQREELGFALVKE